MTRPYRPSNGTEGRMFMARWCERCERDRAYQRNPYGGKPGCEIIVRAMSGADEPLPEWVADDALGTNARCTAFQPLQPPRRDPRRQCDRRQDALPLDVPPRVVQAESDAIYTAVCELRRHGYAVWRAGHQHRIIRGSYTAQLDHLQLKALAVSEALRERRAR